MKKFLCDITQKELKDLFYYDNESGLFFYKKINKYISKIKIGDIAGYNENGYNSIQINKKHYKGHRLAWLYIYGEWPKNQIDHINGIRNDNRICNLRVSNYYINSQNLRKPRKDNTTGYLGVSIQRGKFKAQIVINKKKVGLGYFSTAIEAHQAYLIAKRKFHKGCTI